MALWLWMLYASWLPPLAPRPSPTLAHPNGYDAALAAAQELVNSPHGTVLEHPGVAPPAELQRVTRELRPTLEELRAALKQPWECPPANPDAAELFPHAPFRAAGRAFSVQAFTHRQQGKYAQAAQSGLDTVELGIRLQQGGVTVHFRWASYLSAEAGSVVETVVPRLTAAEARTLGKRLDHLLEQMLSPAGMARRMNGLWLHWFQEYLTRGRSYASPINPYVSPPPLEEQLQERTWRALVPKHAHYQEVAGILEHQVAELEKPFPLRQMPWPGTGHVYMGSGMDYIDFSEAHTDYLSRLRLLRLMLALQEFRERSGRFPAQLRQLAPGCVRQVPLDPFTGKPFRYQGRGTSYHLYGLGKNLSNDHLPGVSAKDLRELDDIAGQLYAPWPKPPAPSGSNGP